MKKIGQIVSVFLAVIIIYGLSLTTLEVGGSGYKGDILSHSSFIDDAGNVIRIDHDIKKIISLSHIHTENIYELGFEDKLVGVDLNSTYPMDALTLNRYDVKKVTQVEAMIKSGPDVILVSPQFRTSNRKLISMLEASDLLVVTLMPDSLEDFDYYIQKLGIIFKDIDTANDKLEDFHTELERVNKVISNTLVKKKGVFIELSESGYITTHSFHQVAQVVELAGGNVISQTSLKQSLSNTFMSSKNKKIEERKGFNISYNIYDDEAVVKVGETFIHENNDLIDAYLLIKGPGYSSSSKVSFYQKDFGELRVYQIGEVYEVASALVGAYTFRYVDGIEEIHRILYKKENGFYLEYINKLDLKIQDENSQKATRLEMAQLIFNYFNLQTYVNSDSTYYDFPKFHHTYGAIVDIPFSDKNLGVVETVVMKFYMNTSELDGEEYFYGSDLVTSKDLIVFTSMYLDIKQDDASKFLKSQDLFQKTYTLKELLDAILIIEGETHG